MNTLLPASLRELYRNGKHFMNSSYGLCPGFLQTNMAMMPSEYAKDFEQFCLKNVSACPLIYKSKVGEVSASFLTEQEDSDIRTDLSTYNIYENGDLIKSVPDLKEIEWEDMVSFYLGCSFSFDDRLINSGIKLRTDSNVSMYLSNIDCIPFGPFNTKMAVSMRPIPRSKLQTAVECTVDCDFAHGAPIHIGCPQDIGINDIMNVDLGAPTKMLENDVPVFWACGVTSSKAIKSAKLPLSISHHPGSMFLCDIKSSDTPNFFKNKAYPKPSVILMDSKNQRYSLLSEKALQSLNQIEFEVSEDLGNRGIKELIIKEDFSKAIMSLHKGGTSIGILFGFPCFTEGSPLEENDGVAGAIYIARALANLDKKVTFIIDSGSPHLETFLKESISSYVENIDVMSIGKEFDERNTTFLFNKETSKPNFSHLLAIERPSPSADGCYNTMKARDIKKLCDPTHILFQQALSSGKIVTIGIGDGGNELGMGKVYDKVVEGVTYGKSIASSVSCDYLITCGVSNWGGFAVGVGLYVLSSCPVFQRFKNHGLDHQIAPFVDIILSEKQDEALNKLIAEKGFRDGINGTCGLTIDNLDYYDVHLPKFRKVRDIATLFNQSMKEYE